MALIKCSECNKEVSNRASACPHCGCPVSSVVISPNTEASVEKVLAKPSAPFVEDSRRATPGFNLAKLFVIALIVFVGALGLGVFFSSLTRSVNEGPNPKLPNSVKTELSAIARSAEDHYGAILAAYGKPERDDSTEYDDPRPVAVTRILEYRPQNVKIALVPNARLGDPPPYASWKIVGCIDINTNTKMSIEEATQRLSERIR